MLLATGEGRAFLCCVLLPDICVRLASAGVSGWQVCTGRTLQQLSLPSVQHNLATLRWPAQ